MIENELARKINLPLLVLYGLGTILGAGIYVLVGKVAGIAGFFAPLSFVIAAVIAWLTAKSYCTLVVLFPKSAGEAVYVEHGFHKKWLTITVGLLIILTGIVSAATLINGFVGYFVLLVPVNKTLAMVGVLILMTVLALWGIAESLTLAALITLVEISGLLIVLYFCGESLSLMPEKFSELFIPKSFAEVSGVFSGAFLAFYAFIGFEDMVNVVEEIKEPEITMPKAISWVVILSTGLYVLIALIATLSMPLSQLAESTAPLADLLRSKNAMAAMIVSIISVFAVVNGVLIQIIMASRVCYGMSSRYGGYRLLHYVSPITKTPVVATILVFIAILIATLFFPLVLLAKFTSFILLTVFTLINIALWKMKRKDYKQSSDDAVVLVEKLKSYPMLAALLCLGLLAFQISTF